MNGSYLALGLIPLPSLLSWIVMFFTGRVDWDSTRVRYLQPPNWVFPVVWTTIYLLFGLFGYLAYVSEEPYLWGILGIWVANLALNMSWTPLFKERHYKECAWIIVAMMGTLGALMAITDNRWGRLCLVPYMTWLTVALLLNNEVARRFDSPMVNTQD